MKEQTLLTRDEHEALEYTVLAARVPDEQYADAEQQHEASALGMWIFLGTEVMFFGSLFLGLFTYRKLYPVEFEAASRQLNIVIGGTNTVVLLVSSVTMVLAVHSAAVGRISRVQLFLALTALLGATFLGLKGLEYYLDFS